MPMFNFINTLFLVGEPTPLDAPITFLLLAITVFTSYKVMDNRYEKQKFMFNPYTIKRQKDWGRFLTHGLIHADWMHLIFNMYVLYMFGAVVEGAYMTIFGKILGPILYLVLYLSGLVMSSLYSYFKYQDSSHYNALGASGAVSGVVFAFMLFAPTAEMGLIFIPFVTLPAFVFGLLYLAFSAYMSKRGTDNIGHDAHFWGSVWGLVFTGLLMPSLFVSFFEKIRLYFASFLG